LLAELRDPTRAADGGLLGRTAARVTALREQAMRDEAESITDVHADYYVLALPVEQMAFYVNRSPELVRRDPALRKIVRLSEHVSWMVGIQFYLTEDVRITRGHIDHLDSEWALTAISQTQFWSEVDMKDRGDGKVRAILSVDISAWDEKGRLFDKEAWNCTPEEIAEEVWHQLKRALNRPGQPVVLRDEMRYGHAEGRWFYLDDSLADRFDRKKQGFYEKFESVRFSANELLRKQSHTGRATETPRAFGQRRLINAEPILVNRAGSWALRPEARTEIRNLFLAADYVRTHTNLACMEAANEAARRAVSEIVKDFGARVPPCEVWPLTEPLSLLRGFDRALLRRGEKLRDNLEDVPVRVAAQVATAFVSSAASMVDRVMRLARDSKS
jgi:hypothetical protein